jgi:subtilase family serine protease
MFLIKKNTNFSGRINGIFQNTPVKPFTPRTSESSSSIFAMLKHNIITTNANPNQDIPTINPHATASPSVLYTPSQLNKAYGLSSLVTPSNKPGLGIKVAVIIAYTYPNLQSDCNRFCTQFGLPQLTSANFSKITLGTQRNSGWALEECLDVQMIHSIAPYATILVVEARSASLSDLNAAITAANNAGADIISMSYGASEFSTELSTGSVFSRANTCYVASSGDTAAVVEFPSCHPNVLSVGGTTLTLDVNGNRASETTWNGGGCGYSQYISKPSYQNGITNLVGTHRACADLSFVANPLSGVYVYYSGSWYGVGGTSVSAPCIAGFLSICNQLRVANSKAKLSTISGSATCFQNMIYQTISKSASGTTYTANFYDITSGVDGNQIAGAGYDLPTGLGSPIGNQLAITLSNL